MLILVVKVITTALVVIGVTLSVSRLGPRLGGIIAGTPIVIGPAFFFLGLEQSEQFLSAAAVAALHALSATLVFLAACVLVAGRLGPLASTGIGILAWAVAAVGFTALPEGLGPAAVTYLAVFAFSHLLLRRLHLPETRVDATPRWPDLLFRGAIAGLLVGLATTLGAQAGPSLSGTIAGFPVGFMIMGLTLHQRFGAPVARATLTSAQAGMFSLVAFVSTQALTVHAVGADVAFWLSLASSLGTCALLLAARSIAIPCPCR
jgi:uncharacterized membrane protein (GlpM family)